MIRKWEAKGKECVPVVTAGCPAPIPHSRLVPIPQLPWVLSSNSSQIPFRSSTLLARLQPFETHTPPNTRPAAHSQWLINPGCKGEKSFAVQFLLQSSCGMGVKQGSSWGLALFRFFLCPTLHPSSCLLRAPSINALSENPCLRLLWEIQPDEALSAKRSSWGQLGSCGQSAQVSWWDKGEPDLKWNILKSLNLFLLRIISIPGVVNTFYLSSQYY